MSVFKATIVRYLKAEDTATVSVNELRKMFEDHTDRAFVRAECLPIVVEYCGVKMIEKERGTGLTFPDTTKGKAAAERLSKLVTRIVGPKSGHKAEKPVVTRAALASAKALVKMCGSKSAAIAAINAL